MHGLGTLKRECDRGVSAVTIRQALPANYDTRPLRIPYRVLRTRRYWAARPRTDMRLRLLIGAAAQRWHLGAGLPMAQAVANWRIHLAQGNFPLPHPSWRNTGWLKANPWFETDLLPDLRRAVRTVMEDG